MKIRDLFEASPIIAAVKDEEGLERAMQTDAAVVFILYGTLLSIPAIVEKIKKNGKIAIVHVDLISGLGTKEVAVDFIRENTGADGIISTKLLMVKRAMEIGLIAGQRTFLIDSMALDNTRRQLSLWKPDFIEIMPGVMPRVLKEIKIFTDVPLVAGGLLSDKRDIMAAFDAGADAVSTTKEALWYA